MPLGKRIRIPVFWQFAVMYLAICCFTMASLSPILDRAVRLSRQSYLTETQHTLDQSGAIFQKSVEEMLLLPQKMNDFSAYRRLKTCIGGSLPRKSYADLHCCKKYMANQLSALEHIEELFLYLPNSNVVLGKNRVFDDVYQYLDFDLVYQDYTPEEFLQFIAGSDSQSSILPASQAKVGLTALQQYLTIIGRRSGDSAVAGALFKESELLRLFDLPTLPDDSFLVMTDAAGKLVYAYQYQPDKLSDERYSLLSTQIAMPPCTVTLGIPNSYFEELHAPLAQMIFHTILAAVLIALICSALFAAFNYLPIRRLERSAAGKQQSRPSLVREYRAIESHMRSSQEEIGKLRENAAEMQAALRSSLFIRLLYGSSEQALAPRLLPLLQGPYRVALVEVSFDAQTPDADALCYQAVRQLFDRLPGEWAYGQLDPRHAALLLGASEAETSRAAALLDSLNLWLEPQGGRAAAGVSGRFSGPDLQAAFCHAQFSLMQAGKGFCLAEDMPPADKVPALNLTEARRFYEMVMACRTEEINRFFDRLQQMLRSGAVSPGEEGTQAFYLLRMVLETAAADARLPDSLLTSCDQGKPVSGLLEGLRQDALQLAEKLTSRQKSAGSEIRADLMAYIRQNFRSPDIYADAIAEEFHMSRSSVYSLVREQTGQSLNEYLEDLRVNEALRLLKDSDMTVAEIASACGYNSANTFYKMFKKRFGLSPSAFRR